MPLAIATTPAFRSRRYPLDCQGTEETLPMSITGPQARAARALVEWPRDHVATLSDLPVKALASFERRKSTLEPAAVARLRLALESGGAVFLDEGEFGVGVRLKSTRKDVRSINRLENEGGPVGSDDV